jgi:hypothetical protein
MRTTPTSQTVQNCGAHLGYCGALEYNVLQRRGAAPYQWGRGITWDGREDVINRRLLVAYGTKYGATAGIAAEIGAALREAGLPVTFAIGRPLVPGPPPLQRH